MTQHKRLIMDCNRRLKTGHPRQKNKHNTVSDILYNQLTCCDYKYEELVAFFLDANLAIKKRVQLSLGDTDNVSVPAKSVFAYRPNDNKQYGVLLIHNHPNGNPMASLNDQRTSYLLNKVAGENNTVFLGSFIITDTTITSTFDSQEIDIKSFLASYRKQL